MGWKEEAKGIRALIDQVDRALSHRMSRMDNAIDDLRHDVANIIRVGTRLEAKVEGEGNADGPGFTVERTGDDTFRITDVHGHVHDETLGVGDAVKFYGYIEE